MIQLMGFGQRFHQEKEVSMNLWVGLLGQVTVPLLHLHLNVQEESMCYTLVFTHPINTMRDPLDLDEPWGRSGGKANSPTPNLSPMSGSRFSTRMSTL